MATSLSPTTPSVPSIAPQGGNATGSLASDGSAADGDAVAAVLAGDRDAYAVLVRRHQTRLYRYALRSCGDTGTAEELVQSALVLAYDRLGHCREPHYFGSWVMGILVNLWREELRRRGRAREQSAGDEPLPAVAARERADDDLERDELRRALAAALERLPEAQREAFLLKHEVSLSYDEMSRTLGVSVSTLKMRVLRARESLRALLAGEVLA